LSVRKWSGGNFDRFSLFVWPPPRHAVKIGRVPSVDDLHLV
jgi:hypothetical protein